MEPTLGERRMRVPRAGEGRMSYTEATIRGNAALLIDHVEKVGSGFKHTEARRLAARSQDSFQQGALIAIEAWALLKAAGAAQPRVTFNYLKPRPDAGKERMRVAEFQGAEDPLAFYVRVEVSELIDICYLFVTAQVPGTSRMVDDAQACFQTGALLFFEALEFSKSV